MQGWTGRGGKSLTASKSLGLVPSWGPAKPRSLGSVRHPCVLGVTQNIWKFCAPRSPIKDHKKKTIAILVCMNKSSMFKNT